MHVPITLKYQKDRIENNQEKVEHHFFRIISQWGIFIRSRADNSILCGSIWSKFELLLDIMHVLNTYKCKMDQINSDPEKVATSIF